MIDLRFFARRKALTAIAVLTRCTRAPGERAGVAVGLVAMWLLSGALKSFVFGVQPTSATVLATSGVLLLALSLVATLPCALRAMRVDIRRGIGGS